MLCTCFNARYRHLHLSKQRRHSLKTVRTEPLYIFQCFIDGIITLIARRMPRHAMSHTIQYHKPLFSHSRMHCSRLTDNCQIDVPQLLQHSSYTPNARHLLFGRCKHYKIVGLLGLRKLRKYRNQCDQASACIVATQAIQFIVLDSRSKRVARPRHVGFDGIYMGIKQNSRF